MKKRINFVPYHFVKFHWECQFLVINFIQIYKSLEKNLNFHLESKINIFLSQKLEYV